MRKLALFGLVGATVAVVVATAGKWVLNVVRGGSGGDMEAVQWPFDSRELRGLMDQVVDDQRKRVEEMPAGADRDRATRFLSYYQERRATVG
jgi:hypothetical protein